MSTCVDPLPNRRGQTAASLAEKVMTNTTPANHWKTDKLWHPLYPFDPHYLRLDPQRHISMHYLDEGPRDARAVVMLHGNPTWSFYYRNLILALRGDFRCIVPDHIGCGLSDK